MAKNRKPWHERHFFLGWFRRTLRNALFGVFRRFAASEEGRGVLAQSVEGVFSGRSIRPEGFDASLPTPYPEIGSAAHGSEGEGAVFITGRFRSGSTLLWNLFRTMNGFTSYYEPHNERRWFDPSARGDRVDSTHKNVSDYWAEYEGLTELGRYYHEEWTYKNLFMDAHSWDADLLAYTRILLARARGRPVLQCNRIDFRLAWHRRHFPRAKIVHLYRHPRDQWCSALMDLERLPPDGRVEDFASVDGFYLLTWCRDLMHLFPFLNPETAGHPYQLFYLVWKLSYLYGRHYADHSLAMEELVEHPEQELHDLFAAVDVDPAGQDLDKLRKLIVKPEMGKWKKYAGDDWFRRHEEQCEATLADFFRSPAAVAVPSLSCVS